MEIAKEYFKNGGDKILINANLSEKKLFKLVLLNYGKQSIVLTLGYKKEENEYFAYRKCGSELIKIDFKFMLKKIINFPVGEIILNSNDNDGTGAGLDFKILEQIPKENKKSIILSGGCGNAKHFAEGLINKKVDAISTSNLFNFVGDGLKN